MNFIKLITDPYDRKARLYPALLLLLPVAIAVTALLSEWLNIMQQILTIAIVSGGSFLLTQFARDAGKKKEPRLFEKWGGVPSIAILRHSDNSLNFITKINYHNQLSKLVANTYAPSVEQENEDRSGADNIYTAWANYLRGKTRDTHQYALLFRENINYGFRRNLWGLKIYGIATSLIGSILCGFALLQRYEAGGSANIEYLLSTCVSIIFILLWVFVFTSSWVRIPAQAYAERLIESIETLSEDTIRSK